MDMVDAFISKDLLVIGHKNDHIKIYSLPWILKNCKVLEASLGQVVEFKDAAGELTRTSAVGEELFGIPYTIKFTGIMNAYQDSLWSLVWFILLNCLVMK